ncbi:hypothetical protein L914_01172, partial [Phytophthora nicotianae]
ITCSRTHRLPPPGFVFESRETPEEVLKILQLKGAIFDDNPLLQQWFRYTEMYRAKMGNKAFTESQILQVLLDAQPLAKEEQSGKLFESLKEVPDLKNIAGNLQSYLFQKIILVKEESSKSYGDSLMKPYDSWESLLKLPKSGMFIRRSMQKLKK